VHIRKTISGSQGNELLDSIIKGEFLDQLSDYQLLKEDSVPWILLVLIIYIQLNIR